MIRKKKKGLDYIWVLLFYLITKQSFHRIFFFGGGEDTQINVSQVNLTLVSRDTNLK